MGIVFSLPTSLSMKLVLSFSCSGRKKSLDSAEKIGVLKYKNEIEG